MDVENTRVPEMKEDPYLLLKRQQRQLEMLSIQVGFSVSPLSSPKHIPL